jgi:hypothetical protein
VRNRWRLLFSLFTVFWISTLAGSPAAAAECGGPPEKAAVAAALTFVRDVRALTVKLVDPELTGAPSAVRTLDAFVVREPDGSLRPVVYLNCESVMFKAAARGSALHVRLLAAVIFHERCHLKGMNETEASAAERGFLADMIQRGLIPAKAGLAYLREMTRASSAP